MIERTDFSRYRSGLFLDKDITESLDKRGSATEGKKSTANDIFGSALFSLNPVLLA